MMWNEHRHTYDLDDMVYTDRFGSAGKVIALSTQPMILLELEDGRREWVSQGTVRKAEVIEINRHAIAEELRKSFPGGPLINRGAFSA